MSSRPVIGDSSAMNGRIIRNVDGFNSWAHAQTANAAVVAARIAEAEAFAKVRSTGRNQSNATAFKVSGIAACEAR